MIVCQRLFVIVIYKMYYFTWQQNSSLVFLEVERILSVEQFWKLHPEVSLLNCFLDTYRIIDCCEITAEQIQQCSSCPQNLFKWNGCSLVTIAFPGLSCMYIYLSLYMYVYDLCYNILIGTFSVQ